MGIRARSFADRLGRSFRFSIVDRSPNKILAIFRFFAALHRARPALCYVFDMGFSGVIAAGLYRAVFRTPTIVDTGDSIYQLRRLSGRGVAGQALTWVLERLAFLISDRIVVRSHPHQELLADRNVASNVIPDGVDLAQFHPRREPELRRHYGLDGFTVIGLLGSLVWNPRFQACYGWELIELIDMLKHLPVKGVIIGDGSGLEHLKVRCAQRGIEDRILFLGRLPYDDLPRFLNMMDICLSTQTNDQVGQVRTTGKLPLYLACGRFVLASAVGEAARVLPPEMLVPYESTMDHEYPARLAARVEDLLQSPARLQRPATSVAIARRHFDYDILAERLQRTIAELLAHRNGSKQGDFDPEPALRRSTGQNSDIS